MRCAECGAESAGATEACLRCGAPVVWRLSGATDPAADAAGQGASAAIPASAVQQPPEPAEYLEKLTELDPATAAPPSGTEPATRARPELIAHPAEPLCCIDTDGWPVLSVSWHPDGRSIAVATQSARARVYDISGKRPKEQVAVKGGNWTTWVLAVTFSPDGTRLATGGSDNSARVWDAASGQQLLEVRHDRQVRAVAFSPDGTRLATGSSDGWVRIWSVAEL
jgi:WD40 repeat protein